MKVAPELGRSISTARQGEVPLAVLLPTGIVGGHEHMLFEWLPVARELGLRPTVYGGANPQLADLARAVGLPWRDARYQIDRKDPLRLAQWRNFTKTLGLALRLPRATPVLLAPGAMQIGLLHVLACGLVGRAVVCYVPITQGAVTHGMRRPRLRDWLTTRLARRVSMWITITEEHGKRLTDYWKIRAPVHVIPNRVAALSQPAAPPQAELRAPGRMRLLYAGRFEPVQKGLDWLAGVLAADEPWMAELSFEFQGTGPFLEPLEALASRAGPERVRVLPWGNVQEALQRADVLLLTSRFEGFPLIAIEALWAGVPVVATLESGVVDVLPRECLYRFGDVAGLRAAIEHLRDPDNRAAALSYARARLSVLLEQGRYERALQGVIAGVAKAAGRA